MKSEEEIVLEKNPDTTINISKDRLLHASAESDELKKVLRFLCPEIFKENLRVKPDIKPDIKLNVPAVPNVDLLECGLFEAIPFRINRIPFKIDFLTGVKNGRCLFPPGAFINAGLPVDAIAVKNRGAYTNKGFFLTNELSWTIVRDEYSGVLVPSFYR